jgi:hypothetical protein
MNTQRKDDDEAKREIRQRMSDLKALRGGDREAKVQRVAGKVSDDELGDNT